MRIRKSAYFLLCALVGILAFTTPATAAPTIPGVPDVGARPPGGTALPTTSVPAAPASSGGSADPSLAGIKTKVDTETSSVRLLEQQALAAKIAAEDGKKDLTEAKDSLDAAEAILAGWLTEASDAGVASYREAQALAPLGSLSEDYRELAALAPGLRGKEAVRGQNAIKDFLTAQRNRTDAESAHTAAVSAEQAAAAAYVTTKQRYEERSAALTTLRAQYTDQIAKLDASKIEYERNQASLKNLKPNSSGMIAAPKALEAVAFAMAQIGKPYVFGAIGPSTYDCSGLVLTAYRQAGINTLPRIANDQYHQTTPVKADELLPGDLLFYSTSTVDWTKIYHVVMYIGDGKVVHAPQPGDVVKTSEVWGSEFFGATRVVPAISVPKPGTSPTPGPAPTPGPTQSPAPTQSPSPAPTPTQPTPTQSTTPSTPPPTPTQPATPSPSVSPSPSQSPDPTPSPRPMAGASPTAAGGY